MVPQADGMVVVPSYPRALAAGGAALFLLAAGCGLTSVNSRLPAARIAALQGAVLTGPVGQALPDQIAVQAFGSDEQPLPGVEITFTASNGGSASPTSAATDANGIARTRWTLGPTAGSQQLTVTAPGGVTATVTATATAGRPASVAIVAGTNQTAGIGAAVPNPPGVRVTDAGGNPVPQVVVSFTVQSGGGTVTGALQLTNAQGTATAGSWILGPLQGTQQLLARVEESGVANNPVLFTATATIPGGSQLIIVAGNNQQAQVGHLVAAAPSVEVRTAGGAGIGGIPVTFAVVTGGGSVIGAQQVTDPNGRATVGGWVLGGSPGTNTLTASAAGIANSPVSFTATAVLPAGTQIAKVAGDNQQAGVGRLVPIAPAVVVRDAANLPVPGVIVTFAVGSGGGSVVGASQVTDANGRAAVGGWFLGPLPGPNTLTASAPGIPAVTFAATGAAGQAAAMVAVSATSQSAPAGTAVADPPSVLVRDAQGTPVPGVAVTFTVAAGGGTVTGSPATTNASGVATLTSWVLGTAVGLNTVTATSPGLPSVTFNATGLAGQPATVIAFNGNNQAAVQGTAVAVQPSVKVTDANGNPVPGVAVSFAIGTGGGGATGVNQNTDALGLATVGSWILGSGTPNTLVATVNAAAVTGNPVTFTAQSATQIGIASAPAGPVTLGASFTITAQLRNGLGTAVALAGIPLTIAINSGAGTLNGTLIVLTDATGLATFAGINLTGGGGGDRTFTVTGTGLAAGVTGPILFNP
jgi:adhesin/invasin